MPGTNQITDPISELPYNIRTMCKAKEISAKLCFRVVEGQNASREYTIATERHSVSYKQLHCLRKTEEDS